MAEPSDLVSEVVQAAEVIPVGPVISNNLDERRKRRAQARRVEALSLRLAGLTYEQIAEKLGIAPDGVRDMVERTLSRAENRAVEAERALENARLDRAQAAIWSKVLAGDLRAVDSFLRLSAQRAKINSLYAPVKIDLRADIRVEMETALRELERVVLGEVVRETTEG